MSKKIDLIRIERHVCCGFEYKWLFTLILMYLILFYLILCTLSDQNSNKIIAN